MDITKTIQEITFLRKASDLLTDHEPSVLMEKIELLSQCYLNVGKLSAFVDGEYKRIYANRKYEQAKAYTEATSHREANAEIAVRQLRLDEAQAYEDMSRWRNANSSLQNEINTLKMKLRVDFADGTIQRSVS